MENFTYCGFPDTSNIGDYALYKANEILFKDYSLSSPSENKSLSSNVNLFGGGSLYPYCLRYGTYPEKNMNILLV